MTQLAASVTTITAVLIAAATFGRQRSAVRRTRAPQPGGATLTPAAAHPSSVPAAELTTGELLVLASAYLCAVHAGDADGKRLILSTVTARELLAGLSLAGRALTADPGQSAGRDTAEVLADLHREAVRRQRELVILG